MTVRVRYEEIFETISVPFWYQMLMIHDEVQLACKPEHTKAIQKESLDAFPQAQEFFGFKCKIEGDSKVGSNWAETH